MFKESKSLKGFIDAIAAAASGLNRGDILLYSVMTKNSGLSQGDDKWGSLVTKVKKRILKDRGIVLVAEHNVGYRFLTVEEQLRDNAKNRGMRGQRQFWRGSKETKAVPDSELTVKQREIKIANSGVLGRARREGLRAAHFVEKATRYESIPINKRPKPLKEAASA